MISHYGKDIFDMPFCYKLAKLDNQRSFILCMSFTKKLANDKLDATYD